MEISIDVNGKREHVPGGTVADLIAARNLQAETLVVEYNGKIIQQKEWPDTHLVDDDVLELLNFVGGG